MCLEFRICPQVEKNEIQGYRGEEIPQVPVKACDTCRYYLKMIDLTADEDAIPVADELVTISLNLRAEESG